VNELNSRWDGGLRMADVGEALSLSVTSTIRNPPSEMPRLESKFIHMVDDRRESRSFSMEISLLSLDMLESGTQLVGNCEIAGGPRNASALARSLKN